MVCKKVLLSIGSPKQWRGKGDKWGHAPWGEGLEGAFKKSPQRRGLRPRTSFASGGCGFRPQTPALLLLPTITTLSSLFLALNAFYYPKKGTKNYSKCSVFASSALCTYFSLQTLQFC